MVKVVLENKEALHAIEDRLQKAVDHVLESNAKLRSSERKLMRNKLTQLTSCLTLKVRAHACAPGQPIATQPVTNPPCRARHTCAYRHGSRQLLERRRRAPEGVRMQQWADGDASLTDQEEHAPAR